ncbi:DUF3488 and transglutaminase-like domain-containing protein [Venenivibrio stagnispumantis]|uniref:Transglutaminase-like enzyme, putative cysteine protease n=1 Tax=Venenivibrio stagnispumantis TaxID=407998 RepID=A0AA45WKB7_9AQUI|nr:transglutaminaseTgpA domain-containing protein [Venenivibrio stagnispumantis]MCW4573483.1 transglutaminaseTgpA domain-containing protein [Venenivibrio stagnispumantis]SMP06755.1 Transglutaminase-like enzyme, putative cysteine protease [Venenivibrio stagnispumantis]
MKSYKVENIVKVLSYFVGFLSFTILFGNISNTYFLISFSLFLVSIYFEYKKYYINRVVINIAGISAIIIMALSMNSENVLQPALETLSFLLSIKFLEEKKFRDYMQIYLLSVLILAASSLIYFGIIFLVYLFIYIFLINISIVLLTYQSQDKEIQLTEEEIKKIVIKTSLIPLLSIPLTIFFFIILPRSEVPIFNLFGGQAKSRTGFSEDVKLGDVSNIQEDNTVIFRASMEKIPENQLYWRGIVLTYFDGINWKVLEGKDESSKSLKGNIIKQTIYLEPYENKYLFGLDKPVRVISKENINRENFSFYLNHPVYSTIKYEVYSVITDIIPSDYVNKTIYLQLPKIDEDIKKLADKLKGKNDLETANNILKFLKYGEYKYSLKNLPISKNPLKDFLIRYKYGNCEYFASSMAVLLRLNNVPARLVAGYKGGIYNNIGKYYMVKQKDAHVWVEAYIDNIGWVRYDPTSAISISDKIKENKISKIKLFFDTINYYYITFVIGFDFKKQMAIFRQISSMIKKPEINFSINKKYILVLILILIIGFLAYKSNFKFKIKTKEEKILEQFLKKMEKYGYKKDRNEGLEEFINKINEKELKERAYLFVRAFENLYYKDKKISKEDEKKLKELIKNI